MDRTLILIKPDIVRKNYIDAVLAELEKQEIVVRYMKMLTFTRALAGEFCAVHRGKLYFERCIRFII